MTFNFIVPELGQYFTEPNFGINLINHVYNNWTTTIGDLAKPVAMQGQSNKIEFRTGLKSDFKSLQVTTLQGRTAVEQHLQVGSTRDLMNTEVLVTLRASTMPENIAKYLGIMEQELLNIVGTYKQNNQTGDMLGIKWLRYNGGERQYPPSGDVTNSDWRSLHSVIMVYELLDVS